MPVYAFAEQVNEERGNTMKIASMPPELANDLALRHKRMQTMMHMQHVDACLLTGNANLCYAIGMMAKGYFYLPEEGSAFLFVHKSMPLEGENVFLYSRLDEIPQILKNQGVEMPLTLALEEDEISAREYQQIVKVFSPAQPMPNANIARTARMIKTPYEIAQMRADGAKLAERYQEIPGLYEAGMTDLEFSASIEHDFRRHGHQGLFRTFGFRMEAHMGTVLAGDNAFYPSPYDFSLGGKGLHPLLPLGPAGHVIQRGMSVMVDLSGNFSGFMLDLSRTFSLGPLTQRAYDLHQISIEILDTLVNMGKPGVLCNQLYEKAYELVDRHGAQSGFMGLQKQAKFIGHGIGYEINELPVISARYAMPLEKDMVIALEPKFVIPGVGAVGAEDSFVVTDSGLEAITNRVTRGIVDLQKL